MKNYFNVIVMVVLATFALGLTSCGGDESEDPQPVETLEDFLVGSWITTSVEYEGIDYADACNSDALEDELLIDRKGTVLVGVNLNLNESKNGRVSSMQDACSLTTLSQADWSLTSNDELVISGSVEAARMKILSVNTGAGTAKAQLISVRNPSGTAIGVIYTLEKQ
jgi:hypothetical protein